MGTLKVWDGSAWQIVSQQGPAGTAPVTSVDGRTGVVNLSDLYVNCTGDTITGTITLTDGVNFTTGSATGTKIGTSSTQKVGFWNTTPVVQNTGWQVAASSYVALKSFDPSLITLANLARVVSTLVDTLKTYGVLGP